MSNKIIYNKKEKTLGQGGQLAIVNGTSYRWRRGSVTYGQTIWDFPDFVEPFSTVHIRVERAEEVRKSTHGDLAVVRYVMDEADGRSFHVHARFDHIQVLLDNIAVSGLGRGSVIDIGWERNGTVTFALAGWLDEQGNDNFFSNGCDMKNWMKSAIGVIGSMTLKQLCIAGSHDSGMSVFESPTTFGYPEVVLTQTRDIADQLAMGIRFFDIRPIIGGGNYYTGHYAYVDVMRRYEGARGQSMQEIVDQLNSFTDVAPGELVILMLSHSFNTDMGGGRYRRFTKEEWDGLVRILQGIKCLFVSCKGGIDLVNTTLNTFAGQHTSAVAVVIKNGERAELGDLTGMGFYRRCPHYHIYDNYANVFNVDEMKQDQLDKMSDSMNHQNKLFMLNWMCTPQISDVALMLTSRAFCRVLSSSNSVLARAATANQSLPDVFQVSSVASFPNIVLTDRVESTNAAIISLAINLRNASHQEAVKIK